jgi:hypothetical protein
MSIIRAWAAKHGVRIDAVVDLELQLGIAGELRQVATMDIPSGIGSEARQQSLVRLEAASKGVRLFRNNSGAFEDKDGRVVRYGLANDSAALNKVIKSSDLVGWRKRIVTPDMVGEPIAQATLREVKPEGWTYSGSAHERAQLAFLELCIADGGDACFTTGPGTL